MADTSEKRFYTPFVLRTGFMHSYVRTLSLLLFVVILEALFWTLSGYWPRVDELGLMRWGLILILALVVPLGTSTIRDVVAGYEKLFDLFDEDTERKLKLYRSLDSAPSRTQKQIKRLFKNEEAYTAFQEGIRQIVFDKTTDIVVISTIVGIALFVISNTINEKVIVGAAGSGSPLLILEVLIDGYATLFVIAALSFTFVFGLQYFFTLSRMGRSPGMLSIWTYIRFLQGDPIEDSSLMSYRGFHDTTSIIGQHFTGVAFRIVLLMTFGGLTQILYNASTSTSVAWTLAALPVAVSILILVLPLDSLHRVMQDARAAVLQEMEKRYDRLTLSFMSDFSKQDHTRSTGHGSKDQENTALKATALRGIMEETRQMPTWPVSAPAVVQIVATSLIPFIYFILEEILRGLLFLD